MSESRLNLTVGGCCVYFLRGTKEIKTLSVVISKQYYFVTDCILYFSGTASDLLTACGCQPNVNEDQTH